MLPLVSVIIPTYNYAQYITEAIGSVLKQTYPNEKIEIVVVDDGSTDNTKQVLQPYIDNGIVAYYYQANRGKANATFEAIKKTSGKYIFNLDADDYYFETKIEKTVRIFEHDPSIVHVAAPAKMLTNATGILSDFEHLPADIIEKPLDGNWLLTYFYSRNILYGGGSTYAARASALKSLPTPSGVDMYIDEYLIMAILPHGKSYFIEEPLSIWRVHGNNYSEKAKTEEDLKRKALRLLKSSEALLTFLKEEKFDKEVVSIYELKYLNSTITYKERFSKKSIKDIGAYAYKVFFEIKPRVAIIKRYHVLNRMLPTWMYLQLKKIA